MSDFSALRLALTSLQAQRRGLQLAAQNAASVNTEGYSRQRVDLESIGAPAVPQQVQVNVNGDDVFGRAGSDLFMTLSQISAAVRTNPAALDALGTTLELKTDQVQTELGQVGARFQRVEPCRAKTRRMR